MSDGIDYEPSDSSRNQKGNSGKLVVLAMVCVGVLAVAILILTRPNYGPPPADVASDPLLAAGREAYLERCIGCHGLKGKGDGATAKSLAGPPVGDLTDDKWKFGGHPDQIYKLIADGVPTSAMPGFRGTFNDAQLRALTAYVLHLSGHPVPRELREPPN